MAASSLLIERDHPIKPKRVAPSSLAMYAWHVLAGVHWLKKDHIEELNDTENGVNALKN